MTSTLLISISIIVISLLVCCNAHNIFEKSIGNRATENYVPLGASTPNQYLWKGGIPYSANTVGKIEYNVLDRDGSMWISPNMLNFSKTIGKVEYDENQDNDYGENYRPGDWNTDGYVASLIQQNPNKPSASVFGSENFTDINVNKVLNITSTCIAILLTFPAIMFLASCFTNIYDELKKKDARTGVFLINVN